MNCSTEWNQFIHNNWTQWIGSWTGLANADDWSVRIEAQVDPECRRTGVHTTVLPHIIHRRNFLKLYAYYALLTRQKCASKLQFRILIRLRVERSSQSHITRSTNTCAELTASLGSLGPLAWVKLSDDQVCFTIIPEQGTQVWAWVGHVSSWINTYQRFLAFSPL